MSTFTSPYKTTELVVTSLAAPVTTLLEVEGAFKSQPAKTIATAQMVDNKNFFITLCFIDYNMLSSS